jgi:imidazoleglycerol phosphate dehydratase HisB
MEQGKKAKSRNRELRFDHMLENCASRTNGLNPCERRFRVDEASYNEEDTAIALGEVLRKQEIN